MTTTPITFMLQSSNQLASEESKGSDSYLTKEDLENHKQSSAHSQYSHITFKYPQGYALSKMFDIPPQIIQISYAIDEDGHRINNIKDFLREVKSLNVDSLERAEHLYNIGLKILDGVAYAPNSRVTRDIY